ncbi:MAG: YcxB family protein [Chitinophagales bacterium]|nr:YcxB family protein [Chitinophagales bacterium]
MSENEFLKLNYKLEEHDYRIFCLFMINKSKNKWLNPSKTAIGVTILVYSIIIILMSKQDIISFFIPTLLFFTLYLIFIIFKRQILWRAIKKRYLHLFNKDFILSISPENVTTSSNGALLQLNYSIIKEIYNIEQYIYIILNENQGIIIPKYKIENIQLQEFWEHITYLSKQNNIPINDINIFI